MADIFYTQASPDWTIESADVTANQHNIHDRNFDSRYTMTGADAATKKLYIDRLSTPMSGSYPDIDTVAITMYSGSYVDMSAGSFVIHQNSAPTMTGRIGSISGSLGTYLDNNTSLFLIDLPSEYTKRYVQIEAVNMPDDPIITQVMLLRKHTTDKTHSLQQSYQYPRWHTKVVNMGGPHNMRYSNFRKPIQAFRRHYPLYGAGPIAQSLSIFNDSRGSLEPFIYTDGLSGTTYVCWPTMNEAKPVNIEYLIDEITITFEEVYRIQSGYNW